MEVRRLPADRITLVGEIDRSEHVTTGYTVRDGALVAEEVDWRVPGWDPVGDREHSVARQIAGLRPVLARGGILLGAFDDETLLGLAVVERGFEDRMAWLAVLHVSRPHRRRGVASALWAEATRLASGGGDRAMYVSATPSESAVGFYLSRGCELARPPHPELFADEPEDIHFVVDLG